MGDVATAWSAAVRSVHAPGRERRHELFLSLVRPGPSDTVLDVGATDSASPAANQLERLYPWPAQITAVGVERLASFSSQFPEVLTVRADGKTLPFPDDSFDIIYSNAVLEHVGDAEEQRLFLAEAARVARRALFVTTPSRSFPVDSHTMVPFAHWLPEHARDAVYRRLDRGAWARGGMRLVSRTELRRLAERAGWQEFAIVSQRFLGLTSVLILVAARGAAV